MLLCVPDVTSTCWVNNRARREEKKKISQLPSEGRGEGKRRRDRQSPPRLGKEKPQQFLGKKKMRLGGKSWEMRGLGRRGVPLGEGQRAPFRPRKMERSVSN